MSDAAVLLRAAATTWDSDAALRAAAPAAARGGFAGSARWMARAMAACRGRVHGRPPFDITGSAPRFTRLGLAKYTAFAILALGPCAVAAALGHPWPLAASIPGFCVAEAWMVFLFPVAIEGATSPFAASRAMTVRGGGGVRVASIVLPISASMLLGGFAGRGFLRSWCIGCIAVARWHVHVRERGAARLAAVA